MKQTAPLISNRILEKLEWPMLLDILASFSQTEEGNALCIGLSPTLSRDEIESRWHLVEPLKHLSQQNYRPPVGFLPVMGSVFRAASLGQIFDGQTLRVVADLLESARKVHQFANDLAAKCPPLMSIRARLYPMPKLLMSINRAVGLDGKLLDDASEELTKIRRQKIVVRKKIEEAISRIVHDDTETEKYLQDDFFTVRSERYVIPIRIDGRGRVKGSILDTSDSGQTLFIEPAGIAPINDQLLELELEEKLEILRIFRELSESVAGDLDVIKGNYETLIEVDFLSAQASLAASIDAGPVKIVDRPHLNLIDARHPLVKRPGDKPAVSNSINIKDGQSVLMISGPNAGGKTVVLKTVGLIHLMAKAGLLVPADNNSSVHLFEKIWLEMGDSQNLSANLSTFSGHLMGLKPILESAGDNDLVLLDELAVGTDPQTGAAIGAAILESLAGRQSVSLVTTHFDALKGMAVRDQRFRNGSMEFSLQNLKPTYKLILDVPGQSYGLEVAEQIGLPTKIIERAKELRGQTVSNLDAAINDLMQARDEARSSQEATRKARLDAEAEKGRWDQERELLAEQRKKITKQLSEKYDDKIQEMRREFEDIVTRIRQALKDSERMTEGRENLMKDRHFAEASLKKMENIVGELAQAYDASEKLPGVVASRENVKAGSPVYILPLKKTGKILKTGDFEILEVEVGIIKLRVSMQDLRLLSPGEAVNQSTSKGNNQKPQQRSRPLQRTPEDKDKPIGLAIQGATNTIDLRGMDADTAIQETWNFIDRSLLKGEVTVIIVHGHGTDILKTAIRRELQNNCPYDVRFRSGLPQEGGDGVTIVALRN
jgi:DNA mismatch repair protein MutS2